MLRTLAAVLCAGFLSASLLTLSARAQEAHVVGAGELDRITADHRSEAQQQRELLLDVLERERVAEAAGRMGVDLVEAREAARTLEGGALEEAAEQAREIDRSLVGGASTVTISTTTLIIVLLLILILA